MRKTGQTQPPIDSRTPHALLPKRVNEEQLRALELKVILTYTFIYILLIFGIGITLSWLTMAETTVVIMTSLVLGAIIAYILKPVLFHQPLAGYLVADHVETSRALRRLEEMKNKGPVWRAQIEAYLNQGFKEQFLIGEVEAIDRLFEEYKTNIPEPTER